MRSGRARTRIGIVVGIAAVLFAGFSLLLARALTGAGEERGRVLDALHAQARGDARGVLALLPACARQPACARMMRQRTAALRRPGRVEILRYEPSVQVALTRRVGTARVAWRAGTGRPVVQCVRVRRDGPVTGGGVELLALSAPIAGEASCAD
jgi:hypothetical protein